jgi:F-type H+-transporting ATPase subunit a
MAAEPGYDFTWLSTITGPLQHAVEVIEEHEVGWYQGVQRVLGVAPPDVHSIVHHESNAIAHAWLACALLVGGALLARAGLGAARAKSGNLQYVPDGTLSARNVFELLVSGFYDLVSSILGHKDARIYFPILAGTFCYILVGNVMGLVPGFVSPTHSFQTNLAMALVILLVFAASGVMRNGVDFFKHMLGPVWYLAWLILPIELLSVFFARPFALTLRLTGNMFGDHLVFGIMSDLFPNEWYWLPVKLLWPVVFLGLGLFVCVIQALVFSLLSTVYIAVSVEHAHDAEHEHAH